MTKPTFKKDPSGNMRPVPVDAMTGSQKLDRLRDLEKQMEAGLEAVFRFGSALQEIRDQRLYEARGHETFEDYCKAVWRFGRSRAEQLISGARTRELLPPVTPDSPAWSERAVREVGQQAETEEDRKELGKRAADAAKEDGRSKVTSGDVQRAARGTESSSPFRCLDKRERQILKEKDEQLERLPDLSDIYETPEGEHLEAAKEVLKAFGGTIATAKDLLDAWGRVTDLLVEWGKKREEELVKKPREKIYAECEKKLAAYRASRKKKS